MKTKNLLFTTLILLCLYLISSCKKNDTEPTLSPARNIAGTWKTAFDVTHYIKTDFCGSSGLLEVANERRMVTWVITVIDDNNVDIQVNYTRSGFTITNRACGVSTGYTPDVSPQFYKGIISSASLTIKGSGGKTKGTFSFTTSLMQGNWNDQWCMVYCQEVYTKTSEFKLAKQ